MTDLEQSFRETPPTPQEFLSEKYLGNTVNLLWPHIKDAFLKTFEESRRHIVLIPDIGWGKSAYIALCNMYMNIFDTYSKTQYKETAEKDRVQYCYVPNKRYIELETHAYLRLLEASPFFEEVSYEEYCDALKKYLISDKMPRVIKYTRLSNKRQIRFSNGNDFVTTDNPINITYGQPLSIAISDTNGFDDNFESIAHMHREFMSRINSRWPHDSVMGMTFLTSSKDYHPEEMADYLRDLEGNNEVLVIE